MSRDWEKRFMKATEKQFQIHFKIIIHTYLSARIIAGNRQRKEKKSSPFENPSVSVKLIL